jgi:ribokinase
MRLSDVSIVVVGSSNTDMIVTSARIPKPGETVLGGGFAMAAGGKGANQAVGAARAGGRVTFIGRVGRDAFGERAVRGLAADGIDVTRVVRDAVRPSGVALIVVARDGENSIAVAPGANAALSAADVRASARAFEGADIVLLQLEVPAEAVGAAVALAAKKRVPVILNPAPARRLERALLERVSILTPNEHEAALLAGVPVDGETSAARAAGLLRGRGVETVIITLGARGAFVAGPGFTGLVPGFKVKAVDTTAAGDIFNGALAVAIGEGKALPDAVRFGHAAAAVSVTRLGAQPSAPSRRVIDRFLRERSKEVSHG